MNIIYNRKELLRLLSALHTLTGIQASVFDSSGKLVCQNSAHTSFCSLIHGSEEGYQRCVNCDLQKISKCAQMKRVYLYRCHAGVLEAITPICVNEIPIFYLTFGQFLDQSSLELQWQRAIKGLNWYRGDLEELYQNFCNLHRYSDREIDAYVEILQAIGSYAHFSNIIQAGEFGDLQRLEIYIDQHYREKITLTTVSEALEISRTKLCSLAKQLSGGKTLSRLIAERRVEEAKLLLLKSGDSIAAIAEAVGIPDYNYFTKIFRSVTGMTPSAFKNQYHHSI